MSSFRLPCIALPLVVGLALLTGACGAPLAVSAVSYGSDGAMLATTNKSVTDHLASMVSKKDCAMWRALKGREVCREREEGAKDPYAVDYNEPQRSVSEDGGVKYGPPLHAAANAPASSWDAAAYKAAPATPAPAPARPEPVTAVAEATPAPAPAAASAAAKPKPPKVARSAKKPSRGQVASAP